MPVESAAIVARLVRALCAESCREPGGCRCVRDETRLVVCGVSRAAAVMAREVARRAIAHRSAPRPTGRRWHDGGPEASCEVLLTLW